MKLCHFLINLSLAIILAGGITRTEENAGYFASQSWDSIENFFFSGYVLGYNTIQQTENLINTYHKFFPELIAAVVNIGQTSQGRNILAMQLATTGASDSSSNIIVEDISTFENKFADRPAILFTGMHDGNDPISMTMNLYILKRIIHGYFQNEPEYIYLLKTRQIWFVPMINQDSYYLMQVNDKRYDVIKNQKTYGCSTQIGVNLRLNYLLYNGSTMFTRHGECDTLYEGPSPFSESETKGIKALLDKVKFILAINYFARYNSVLLPFNFMESSNLTNSSIYKKSEDKEIFSELLSVPGLPSNPYSGNNYGFRKEAMNGEVSDYMYHQKNVYALSVELGHSTILSSAFPLSIADNLVVFRSFYPLALYSIFKIGNQYEWSPIYHLLEDCLEQHLSFVDCSTPNTGVFSAKYKLSNFGISNARKFSIQIQTPLDLKITNISIQSDYNELFSFNDTSFTKAEFSSSTDTSLSSMKFKTEVEFLASRSSVYVSLVGLYPSSVDLESKSLSLSIVDSYSYNDSQIVTKDIVSFGGVQGYKKIIKDDIKKETNPRAPSIILIIVYFVSLAVICLVSLGIYGASKYQEKTSKAL